MLPIVDESEKYSSIECEERCSLIDFTMPAWSIKFVITELHSRYVRHLQSSKFVNKEQTLKHMHIIWFDGGKSILKVKSLVLISLSISRYPRTFRIPSCLNLNGQHTTNCDQILLWMNGVFLSNVTIRCLLPKIPALTLRSFNRKRKWQNHEHWHPLLPTSP